MGKDVRCHNLSLNKLNKNKKYTMTILSFTVLLLNKSNSLISIIFSVCAKIKQMKIFQKLLFKHFVSLSLFLSY